MRPKNRCERVSHYGFGMVLALLVAACGAASDAVDDAVSEAEDRAAEAAADAASEAAGEAVDAATDGDPLAAIRAIADSIDETTTPSGARIGLAVVCVSIQGTTQLIVGVANGPPGIYEGTVKPAVGGDLTVQVLDTGVGGQARQTELDDGPYTVTYPDFDGGVSLTVDGCG